MTALQSYTTTSVIVTSSDDSIFPTSTSTSTISASNTPAADYKTVAAIDLFHYPESDFKDSNRHRAYLGQKSRERSTRNFIWRKIQQGAASQKDRERIERKLNQRKNKNSGSENTSDDDDENQNVNDDPYFKDDISDSDNINDDDNDDEEEVVAPQESNKKQYTNNSTKKAAKKSNAPERDHKKALGLDITATPKQHRSNKRADRRRRPEDEILSDDDNTNTNNATPSLASSASWASSSDEDQDHNDNEEAYDEILLGEEERIRFKHNLTFKTDDQSAMSSPRVDLRSWKRAFVQRLDEQDQARSSSGTETNGRNKQNKQNRQKEKKNKGSRDFY